MRWHRISGNLSLFAPAWSSDVTFSHDSGSGRRVNAELVEILLSNFYQAVPNFASKCASLANLWTKTLPFSAWQKKQLQSVKCLKYEQPSSRWTSQVVLVLAHHLPHTEKSQLTAWKLVNSSPCCIWGMTSVTVRWIWPNMPVWLNFATWECLK